MFVYVSLLSPPLPFFSQPAGAVFTGCLLFTRCASRGKLEVRATTETGIKDVDQGDAH